MCVFKPVSSCSRVLHRVCACDDVNGFGVVGMWSAVRGSGPGTHRLIAYHSPPSWLEALLGSRTSDDVTFDAPSERIKVGIKMEGE